MFGGGPGEVGGPSAAAAITQTLHWLSPAPGRFCTCAAPRRRAVARPTREYWQSADRPAEAREVIDGDRRFEVSGESLYDPATNTIYEGSGRGDGKPADPKADPAGLPASDPVVRKVRILLQEGNMEVTGREVHNGTDAWAVSLKQGVGRPVWTLWVSTADGKPLELRDPGRDANEAPQVIRWPAYEVLPARDAAGQVTLRGAHPSARVVRDPQQVADACGAGLRSPESAETTDGARLDEAVERAALGRDWHSARRTGGHRQRATGVPRGGQPKATGGSRPRGRSPRAGAARDRGSRARPRSRRRRRPAGGGSRRGS
jgi:hypothetical protein